jgi:hypothetical protein
MTLLERRMYRKLLPLRPRDIGAAKISVLKSQLCQILAGTDKLKQHRQHGNQQ